MSGENRINYFGIKRQFDPTQSNDLKEYKYFLEKGRWQNTCPFICEPPYESVIFLIERRIVEHCIDDLISKGRKREPA
jgi:hypothetical protein